MDIDDKKGVLIKMYLIGRTLVKAGKKLDKGKTMLFITLFLLDEKPRTIQELSVLFSVNHSFMSAFISDLEKKGIIKKKLTKDHRFRKVNISVKGKELRRQIAHEGHRISNTLSKNLSEEEILLMNKLLDKLNVSYDELLNVFDYDTLKR